MTVDLWEMTKQGSDVVMGTTSFARLVLENAVFLVPSSVWKHDCSVHSHRSEQILTPSLYLISFVSQLLFYLSPLISDPFSVARQQPVIIHAAVVSGI